MTELNALIENALLYVIPFVLATICIVLYTGIAQSFRDNLLAMAKCVDSFVNILQNKRIYILVFAIIYAGFVIAYLLLAE